jgi:Ca2+-transporting ATPase
MTPRGKLIVVSAFQRLKKIVAMTGDGVNDAPAVKQADIGIAMGSSGTDVCKEAADMILLDDDLSTLVLAVSEGKTIFSNIQNFVRFQVEARELLLSLLFKAIIAVKHVPCCSGTCGHIIFSWIP